MEKQIGTALRKHGIAPVSSKQVEAAARALHVAADDAHLAAIAQRLRVAAVVEGDVRDRGTRAQIKARGADGHVLADGAWSVAGGGKKLAKAVGRSVWSRIGPALESAPSPAPAKRGRADAVSAVAAAPPPSKAVTPAVSLQPSPPPPSKVADAEGSEFGDAPVLPKRGAAETIEREGGRSWFGSGGGGPAALDVSVGPRLVSRDLSWNKIARGTVTPISIGNAPTFGFQAAWYPAAHFRGGWPAYLGVVASGEFTPGGDAQAGGGPTYPTSGNDYWGGARVRVPLNVFERLFEGALTVGYGQHTAFIHDGTNAPRASLAAPDMAYSYLRVGADGRMHLPARFSVMGGVAYRAVLGAGSDGAGVQSMAFFPRATLTAVDVNAAVGYRVMPLIEARLGFDLRRYGFDMHPQGTDALVVSGAIDQYVAFWLNLAVLLDGKS